MEKFTLWSIIFASFPEELLIVITTMATVGYKEVLNFKNKSYVIKLLTASILMVITSEVGYLLLPSITINSAVQFILFYLIIISVYRCKPVTCLLGFILSILIIVVSESLFFSVVMKITNINLSPQQMAVSDWQKIVLSLPDRIFQITSILIIYKLKNINLKIEKLRTSDILQVLLYMLMIFTSMYSIEKGVWNITSEIKMNFSFILNVVLAVILSSWLIYNIFKIRKRMLMMENIRDVELHHVKQLIQEGQIDHVVELIDITLKQRGYYGKQ